MISYEKFTLRNGLQVFVHEDHSTPMAVLNVLYNVGSRDESSDKTGFAHLFEHLMFGGSINIASYDDALQKVGGENNAFTSPDITNYYLTLPANNLETAFWLESDRMLSLAFDTKSLEVQRKVVIEEFNQRYLNQPYGDVWLKLRPLAYQVHPYAWATIGKEVSHIENATMEDVKAFFAKFYIPNNAVMVVAGNVTLEQVKSLSEKWFEPIPAGVPYVRNLPEEPQQTEPRRLEITSKVPANAIYKTWHSNSKLHPDHVASDLLSDLLGHGKASRLYIKLVKENPLFSSIGAHVSGSVEAGLFIVEGKLNEGIGFEVAENAINEVINDLLKNGIAEQELTKVKNQAESTLVFSEVELLNRAMQLAFAANLGNVDLANQELEKIQAVTVDQVNRVAREILVATNCSTLIYKAEQ
jgi:zinc protease